MRKIFAMKITVKCADLVQERYIAVHLQGPTCSFFLGYETGDYDIGYTEGIRNRFVEPEQWMWAARILREVHKTCA